MSQGQFGKLIRVISTLQRPIFKRRAESMRRVSRHIHGGSHCAPESSIRKTFAPVRPDQTASFAIRQQGNHGICERSNMISDALFHSSRGDGPSLIRKVKFFPSGVSRHMAAGRHQYREGKTIPRNVIALHELSIETRCIGKRHSGEMFNRGLVVGKQVFKIARPAGRIVPLASWCAGLPRG